MTISITLTAADGATDTITLAEPTVNAPVTGPFANQCVTCVINGKTLALDYTASIGATPDASTGIIYQAPSLLPYTGAAGQLWSYEQLTNSGILTPINMGWFDLDGVNLWFGVPWDDATSTGNMAEVGSVSFTYGGNYLQPNSAGTGVEMAATPFTWTITAPPSQQQDPPPPGQSYAPSTYVKVWEDTFTGTSLDTTKWWTRMAGDNGLQQNISSNGELELYSESNNHVMTGSSVKLTAYPPASGSSNYLSGMLRGKQALHVGSLTTSFYIEVVCKIPNATGSWPAFWFSAEPTSASVTPPWPPEADAFEFMNNGSTNSQDVHMSVKENGNVPGPWNALVGTWDGAHQPAGWTWNADGGDTKWLTTVDFSQEFHTFACEFSPGAAGTNINPATGQPTHNITYYIDGWAANILPYDFQMGADGSTGWNAELLLNLAVGGFGGGTPNPAEYPCAFEIQRVSIFLSQEDSTALVPSVVGQDLLPPTGG